MAGGSASRSAAGPVATVLPSTVSPGTASPGTASPNTMASFSAMAERDLYYALERLQTEYILAIDDGRLEDWPDFFVEDCLYRIIPKENFDLDLPAAVIHCDNRRMLLDRVTSLRTANIYQPHQYRHLVSGARILARDDDVVKMQSNYVVFQTLQDGETHVYQAGRYLDSVVWNEGRLKFREKHAVFDTSRVRTLLATPI